MDFVLVLAQYFSVQISRPIFDAAKINLPRNPVPQKNVTPHPLRFQITDIPKIVWYTTMECC